MKERPIFLAPSSLVCALARVDPVAVDVNGFGKIVYSCLKIFQTDSTGDTTCIPLPVHFDFARALVVAERTVELRLQWFNVLALRRRLSLAPASSHPLKLLGTERFPKERPVGLIEATNTKKGLGKQPLRCVDPIRAVNQKKARLAVSCFLAGVTGDNSIYRAFAISFERVT